MIIIRKRRRKVKKVKSRWKRLMAIGCSNVARCLENRTEINMVARDGNFYFIKTSLGTGF